MNDRIGQIELVSPPLVVVLEDVHFNVADLIKVPDLVAARGTGEGQEEGEAADHCFDNSVSLWRARVADRVEGKEGRVFLNVASSWRRAM